MTFAPSIILMAPPCIALFLKNREFLIMKVLVGVLDVKYMVPPSTPFSFEKVQLSISKFWQLQYIALPYTIRFVLSLKVVLKTEMFPKLE